MREPQAKRDNGQRAPDSEHWKKAHWRQVGAGDLVCVTRDQEIEATGIIDTFTCDRSVFWIHESAAGERRILLPHDGIEVWLAHDAMQPAPSDGLDS